MTVVRTRVVERPEDLPETPDPEAVHVVVDVLRFSTTACALLEAGASYLRPFPDGEAARAWREEDEPDALLVGENQGETLPGFDANNSPTQAPDHDVGGRPVGVVTTNGTRTIEAVGPDPPLVVGTLANAPALADHLAGVEEVVLVGAGWEGEPVEEDSAVCWLLSRWLARGRPDDERIEEAREAVASSTSAQHVRQRGYGDDVEACAAVGAYDVVPVRADGVLVPDPGATGTPY